MITLTNRVNQYRTMSVGFLSFPCEVDNIELVGFVKNNGVSEMKGLTIWNFQTISYLKTTEKGFIHAIGYTGDKLYQLILKRNEVS